MDWIETNTKQNYPIETGSKKGEVSTLCPVCSAKRKNGNKTKRCLSLNTIEGVGYCHNCNSSFHKAKEPQYNSHDQKPAQSTKQAAKIDHRPLNEAELAYWQQYDIQSKILEIYQVYGVDRYQVGKHSETTEPGNPIFCYHAGGNSYKIYRPFAKEGQNKFSWINGKPESWYFGLQFCKDTGRVFLAAGEKDVLTLVCQGVAAFTLNSETAAIPEAILKQLRAQCREIIVLYDNDETGTENSLKLAREHRLKRAILPNGIKDVSDLIAAGRSIDEIRYEASPAEAKFQEMEKAARIDTGTPRPEEPYILTIDGVPVASLGSFTLINGKQKSRKTHCNYHLTAAFLRGEKGNYVASLPADKRKVLYFDTEQSRGEAWDGAKKIELAAGTRENLNYYNLRPYTPEERIEFINWIITTTTGAGVVFIDGIRDLVNNINDPAEATKVATNVLKWTTENNLHIICTLHLNKSDNNARGHLGTELINKAQTIIEITKPEDGQFYSTVAFSGGRGMEFKKFGIGYTDEGLPVQMDLEDLEPTRPGKKAITPDSIPINEHCKKLEKIIPATGLTYEDLANEIKEINGFGLNKAKDFIKYYREQDLILKQNSKYIFKAPHAAKNMSNKNEDETPF